MISRTIKQFNGLPSTFFRKVDPQDIHIYSFTHSFNSVFDKNLSNLYYAPNIDPGTIPGV